ncbi:MAG: class I SAM-dependent methyltransferase [bacterium]|nr:MAG: class I SAM-dependent methyltransferase [bacterium]
MKAWYEKLFTNYAQTYDREPFTQGTPGEVDFIEDEIEFHKTETILDIGCGTGRHAIELARRGYQVTGIDISESQLKWAREKAQLAGVQVRFLKKDARKFTFRKKFDAIIMICEGAFSLMETDEMNFQILQHAEKSLKNQGVFIFTCLNALFPLYHSVKDFLNAAATQSSTGSLTFDLITFRETSEIKVTDDSGNKRSMICNERYYTPSEIHWLLTSLQFRKVEFFGCKLGAFSREDPLTTEDFEMLVVARK